MGANATTNKRLPALPKQRQDAAMTLDATAFNRRFRTGYEPGFLGKDVVTFQCRFSNASPMYLVARPAQADFIEGECATPTLTLYLADRNTLYGLLEGTINGMDAFMTGDYRADGHIVLSQLVLYAFRNTSMTPDLVAR